MYTYQNDLYIDNKYTNMIQLLVLQTFEDVFSVWSLMFDAWCLMCRNIQILQCCRVQYTICSTGIFPHPCLKLAGWLDTWGADMWQLCKCSSSCHRMQTWYMWVKLFSGTWKVGYMWVCDLYNSLVSRQMGCPAWEPAMTNMLKAGNPICVSLFI